MLAACSGDGPADAGEPPLSTTAGVGTQPTAPTPATSTTAAVDLLPVLPRGDRWKVDVLDRHPHDPTAFTQGLVMGNDVVYESSGLYGMSWIRSVNRTTGDLLGEQLLAETLFGEGLELIGDRLIQLTWRAGVALVWDASSLEQLGTFDYEGEAWGLCGDGDRFVVSDGSSQLTFRDLADFSIVGSVEVVRNGQPIDRLNELECVGNLVFANVWQSDEIVVIDPDAGLVVATIDAAPLAAELGFDGDSRAVLNGIAYDELRGTFLLTGKLWPTLFEVEFSAAAETSEATNSSGAPITERLETRAVDVDGLVRSYVLYTPSIDDPTGPPALVVDLHGFTSTPDRHDEVSQMRALADVEGFVVAQPFGLGGVPSWDPSADGRAGAQDVEFIRALVADADDEVGIDEQRVFAMGFSNGGGMAHRLACDASDVFAAIGTVAGAYVDAADCDADSPVAVVSFHGTRDIVVPYAGAGAVFVNVPQWAADWAERNECAAGPVRQELFPDVYADAWSDCDSGADVVLFTVVDGLHSWPGGPAGGLFGATDSISASSVFWEFFESHTR